MSTKSDVGFSSSHIRATVTLTHCMPH